MEVKPSGLIKLVLHGLLVPKTILELTMEELLDLKEKTPIPMKSNKAGNILIMVSKMQVQMMSSSKP